MSGLMDVMAKRRQTRIAGGRVSHSCTVFDNFYFPKSSDSSRYAVITLKLKQTCLTIHDAGKIAN